ncbi:lipase [Kitasatospora cheerisanensis KCTC 2395]|uniref:Lipase n=1 Tax=Kitasatospora cheerisanensis KCTC 2395 TaxID=1348663 RepID=A0A066Z4X3_9ACTN|nr:lipase [Kitasatospora cheerisanensis KCTC 2395]
MPDGRVVRGVEGRADRHLARGAGRRGRRGRRGGAADGRARDAPAGPGGTGRGGAVRFAARSPRRVRADDGTELYVEVDAGEGPGPTVVFCHGYCLNQDSWHFQRAALRGALRTVFWDHRSHGRSERSRSYLKGEPASIDQLGGDLRAVLDAVVPDGPVVLVGHSMGGMTVLALAAQHPELFGPDGRVTGVALIGTLAGGWDSVTLGLPAAGAKVVKRVAPGVVRMLGRQVELVEATRRWGSELAAVFYRRFSFGTKDVDPGVVRFAEQLLDATPIDVVAEFYPAFSLHDKQTALAALDGVPTLVMAGTKDLLTPPEYSEAIAAALPGARLVLVENAGHLLMLERPGTVDRELVALLERAADRAGTGPLPEELRAAGDEPPEG